MYLQVENFNLYIFTLAATRQNSSPGSYHHQASHRGEGNYFPQAAFFPKSISPQEEGDKEVM